MLKCNTCGLIKSQNEFTISGRSKKNPNKVWYKNSCKSCCAKEAKRWKENEGKEYVLNYKITSEQKEKYNKNRRIKDMKRKEVLIEMLGGKCVSCGAIENLQFDHIDPTTKSFSIAKKYICKAVFEEIKKCQLLCYNCHLEKTAEDYKQGKFTTRSSKKG